MNYFGKVESRTQIPVAAPSSECMKNHMEDFDGIDKKQARIMGSYVRRGFVKDNEDTGNLHMSFSPYGVPSGLTKLQIRRRINKYLNRDKTKDKTYRELLGNRVEISVNGRVLLGANVTTEPPKNHRELLKLLKNLVKFIS